MLYYTWRHGRPDKSGQFKPASDYAPEDRTGLNSRCSFAPLFALVASLATSSAIAGSPYQDRPNPVAAEQKRLAAIGVLNVPDRRGCVKDCLADINPCDPPELKRDGRCQEP